MVHPTRRVHRLRSDNVDRHSVPVRVHARDRKQNAARDRTIFHRRFERLSERPRQPKLKHDSKISVTRHVEIFLCFFSLSLFRQSSLTLFTSLVLPL